jgi:hypothetical protein
MLHCNQNCRSSAVVTGYTCSAIIASLFFVAWVVPLSAQTDGSANFESRFFFNESPSPVEAPESASRQTSPITSERKPESQGVHPAPSSGHSLFSSPAAAAPAPTIESPTSSTSSDRTPQSQEAHPTTSSEHSFTNPPAASARAAVRVSQRGRPIGSGRAAWYEHPSRTASGEKFDPIG